ARVAPPSLGKVADIIDAAVAAAARGKTREGATVERSETADGASRVADPGDQLAEPEECALGAGQRALWFLHQLDPEGAAYPIAAALALEGPVDDEALARAVDALLARHA